MATIFSFLLLVVLASGSLASTRAPNRPASAVDTYIIVIKENFRAKRGSKGPTEFFMRINLKSNSTNSSNVQPKYGSYISLHIGYIAEMNVTAFNMVRNFTDVDFTEDDAIDAFHPDEIEWHVDRIDQRPLPRDGMEYDPQYTGRGVHIYIIDSGIEYSHHEFWDMSWLLINLRATYGGFDPVDEPGASLGSDLRGHGTHVAGLAIGETVGVARGANAYSVKVFGKSGGSPTSRVIMAMEHVIDRAEMSSNRVIMSMSLGGSFSESMNEEVKFATTQGIVPVVSAGNDGFDACKKSPASSEYAITVGATKADDSLPDWTNYGKCVDIFAPGYRLKSASHEDDNEYTIKSGTSMATPIVSGVAAMLLEEDPSLTPQQVKCELIRRSTKNALDLTSVPPEAFFETPNRLVYVEPRDSQSGNLGSTTASPRSICYQRLKSYYYYYSRYLRYLYRYRC